MKQQNFPFPLHWTLGTLAIITFVRGKIMLRNCMLLSKRTTCIEIPVTLQKICTHPTDIEHFADLILTKQTKVDGHREQG